jgi:muramidase (phage lysozyme)
VLARLRVPRRGAGATEDAVIYTLIIGGAILGELHIYPDIVNRRTIHYRERKSTIHGRWQSVQNQACQPSEENRKP